MPRNNGRRIGGQFTDSPKQFYNNFYPRFNNYNYVLDLDGFLLVISFEGAIKGTFNPKEVYNYAQSCNLHFPFSKSIIN